jgi:ABC-type transport system involved in cytochrome c biogenesis permease subunit
VNSQLILLPLALAACVAAGGVALAQLFLFQPRLRLADGTQRGGAGIGTLAEWSAAMPLAVLVLSIAVRAMTTGRAPIANLHEVVVAVAAAVLALHLGVTRRIPGGTLLAVFVAGVLIAIGMRLSAPPEPLVPALQAPLLLPIHVGSAVVSYAAATVAAIAAAGELTVTALGPERARWLPSAARLRAITHRAVIIALPVLTAAIALGSVWANLAWRSYWSNDPKELSAAAIWLILAAYLHAVGRRDRWGQAAPWLAVFGFGAVLFTLIGASLLFGGQHSYAQV